jgi:hypothetical protein
MEMRRELNPSPEGLIGVASVAQAHLLSASPSGLGILAVDLPQRTSGASARSKRSAERTLLDWDLILRVSTFGGANRGAFRVTVNFR